MKVQTARFGELEIPNDSVIHFPDGIAPFGRDLAFAVIGDDCSGAVPQPGPVAWLQCLELPELAFWVGHAGLLLPDRRIELEPHHLRLMHIRRSDQLGVLLILTLQNRQVTANLLAPLLLNTARRLGRQVILTGGMDLVRTVVPAERFLGQPV